MKKFLTIIVIAILAVLAFVYFRKGDTTPTPSTTKTYRNSAVGLSFTYPNTLTASTSGTSVIVHHEVPFEHPDFCDFKGDNTTTYTSLTDFHVVMKISNKNIVDTMKQMSPYIPQENFVNDKVVPSPGFIDEVNIGNLDGYKITEGVEGCGKTTYYLKISDNKTLVATSDIITIFTGAIPEQTANRAKAIPGVITNEEAERIFKSIIGTVKAS